ncbi:MAG: symmetrical bis(5'-nucleosyl)-tetraphosphatase [Pseudomonadales bacterium]|jgi:bis(5'-nucleosyl)-tetraphosphatase (symmetrical)|nr:symmetrical bis(5'-nucleosyl)-tetraphosphatase [Pseudomonadales bacterium]MDP6470782.1 symmetrical bis(5'-nucleosyl)-tetraphosphatase [Pseudomonadales bacterium]MDP6828266.1 symmetrical bis(5'-nucleosyl)-tetraphosphatase [Pseudomonadales bacterium]MDP6973010.1 symmetrical bis(5'-nucleosyl)-tetraphosphatase [Pseudomonadales bacterium]|tara:strand:- start:1373 stop:2182 length:810 start_codon:yes stop_codon:yes gene_type:complete
MATYAIGDIQGCYAEFNDLLERVAFSPEQDRLWLLGDLVNRGPDSLGVLRMVSRLREASVVCVLGNHDLHMLAIVYGGHSANRGDTFQDVLAAHDCVELADWLRQQKLFHWEPESGYAMAHAGVPPMWTFPEARRHSAEVMQVINGKHRIRYFRDLYGNEPGVWDEMLEDMPRWRVITNYFTRMRLIAENGRLNFSHKGSPSDAPPGWVPWFERAPAVADTLLFGHWAALEGHTGRLDVLSLDTGCVWGRTMTALCLETGELCQVSARS